MRTFLEIYNDAELNGIVEVFEKTNVLKAQYLIMGWDTNSINYEFTQQQLLVLSSLQHEITGIRPGNCSGCIYDVIRRMNTWIMKNKPLPEPPQVKQNEPKRKRKA
jgi:hypothetical protein